MRSFKWLVLLCCASFNQAFSQQDNGCIYTLEGQVIDEHDNSELAFATIALEASGKGVIANEKGSFLLNGLCQGWNVLLIRHIGCSPLRDSVFIEKNEVHTFYLEHHAEQLKEMEISGKRLDQEESIQAAASISGEELARSAGQSLGETLKKVSGVNSLKTGTNVSKPMIHGLHSNRLLIVNNGVNHQSQRWGDEHAPEIDPFASERLKVIKGAESVRYGSGAIGGVVIVEPRAPVDTVGILGEVSMLGATNQRLGAISAMLQGKFSKLERLSWRIQGALKKGGNVKTPNYYLDNSGIEEANFSWNLNYRFKRWDIDFYYSQFNSTIGIFSGAHIGNLTDLQDALERSQPRAEDTDGFSYQIDRPFQQVVHELHRARFNYRTTKGHQWEITLARQFNERQEYDKELPRNDALAALNLPEFDLNLTSYAANFVWKSPLGKMGQQSAGINYLQQTNTLDGSRNFIPAYDAYNTGLFFWQRKKWKKWKAEAGARADVQHYGVFPIGALEKEDQYYTTFSAQLGTAYSISSALVLGAAVQWSMRPPAVNELYSKGLHHGVASLEYGDNKLQSEQLLGSSIYVNYDAGGWKGRVNAYQNYINDFIYLRPTGTELTVRGAFPAFQWSQTNAVIRGLDIDVERQLTSKFKLNAQSSLLWARNLSENDFLINMPAQRFSVNGEYEWLKNDRKNLRMTVFSSLQRVNRQKRSPAAIEIAPAPNGYTLLSAGVSAAFRIKKQDLLLSIQLENATNEAYRDYLDRFRFYTDQMGRNLSFRLKIPFKIS